MRKLTGTLVSLVTVFALAACSRETQKAEVKAPSMTPVKSGYADVNGIRLYHEIHGTGEPLVLLHGGFMMIPEMAGLLQPLAKTRQVIAVEVQGHGRTADNDRPLSLETMGDDMAALLDHLGIAQADFVGFSLGGNVALRTAFQHPQRVRRLVAISTAYKREGWYPEARKGMEMLNAGMAEQMKQTPTGKASEQWPQPERFPQFLDKVGRMISADYDWTAEVKKLPMPVMLVYADHDSISQQHIAEYFALLGGGITEPGWQNTKFTKARLAIVPGYSHYNLMTSPEVAPTVEKFLADPRL